ncbi:MAG: NAD(P)/FAD-dependent oxidoreductase [Acidimicrobiia bacterium]|nr:NAD(P)/FAD-dependent oxidoreductase [Acidimicrobiia bacterium]
MGERADVITIGMGIGGEAVAGSLAEGGLDVIGIDANLVGGECPYWGCIPSKMMIRAANLLAEARRIPGTAGAVTLKPDWAPVAARIREQATDNWNDQVAVDRFEGKGGRFVRGRARIEGPGVVTVDGTAYEADRAIVVAVGTDPALPPIPGLADVDHWTNREAIQIDELPRSLIVLGAGAIGTELAQVFARFGVEVTVIEALDRLVPLEEPEAGQVLAEAFAADGIKVHVGARATAVHDGANGISVTLDDGAIVTAERLLVATGRRTDLAGLGWANLGLDPDARFAAVDDHMRVIGTEGLWAVGDITGHGLFTHVAAYQAPIATAAIQNSPGEGADYRALPRVTFTDPEVGSVGLTEAAARDAGRPVTAVSQLVPHSARGWLHGPGNEGLVKLVIDDDRQVLVGATSVGPHGGEVLGMLTLAVHAEVPVATLRSMIYAYPTFHRAVEDALNQL